MILATTTQAMALNQRITTELKSLDPEEELEQRCDVEALSQINDARKDMYPDKVIAYTFAPPSVKGNTIDAHGAAFRSHEHWYRLTYHCVTDRSELTVKSFSFKIGAEIPRAQWDRLYLYP
ncbi:signal peptide protein [Martelella endophytica]|uniref:Signal peptide protein n=1 Tax=Martelella endophytica TaxID=1486262 RepID=A0A0D5LUV9_MAREN|nr:signal peptide protein [Martelella endophytica]